MPQRCNAEASERGANLVAKNDMGSTTRASTTTTTDRAKGRGTDPAGFFMVPKWLACRSEVSGNAKLLYGLLASHGDGKEPAPGRAKGAIAKVKMKVLEKELGESYKTIRRLVRELKEHGLIHVGLNREKSAASDYYLLEHKWMAPQVTDVLRLGSELGGSQVRTVPSLGSELSLPSGQICPEPRVKNVPGEEISSRDPFQDPAAEIASARAYTHTQVPARAGSGSSGKNGSRAPLAIVPADAIVPDAEQQVRQAAIVRVAEQKKAIAKHDAKKEAEQKKQDADAAIKSMLTRPPEEQKRQLWSIRSRFLSNGDAERGGMSEEELAERIRFWKGTRSAALDALQGLRDSGRATTWNIAKHNIGRYLDQREIDAVLAEPRRPALPVPVVPSSAAAPVSAAGEGEVLNEREASNDW